MLQDHRLQIDKVGGAGGGGSVSWKTARRTASAVALPAYTRVDNVITANAFGALPAIGGVTLVAGDSFLLKDGAAGADNGLWDVTVLGDAGTAFVLTRSEDADTDAEVTSGMRVPITEGTYAGLVFYLETPDPIILNTTALSFVLETTSDRLTWKNARRAASAAALPAYTRVANVITANAFGALPAVGGVALVAGDSFLLKNGAAGADNGLYDVTVLGNGGTAFVLTRSTDANTDAEVTSGLRVPITEGTYAGLVFYLSTLDPIALNTTALTFELDAGSVIHAVPVAVGAYSANDTVPGVAVAPGWNILAEFDLDVLPVAGAVLDGIMLVSGVALTGELRLYDVTGAAAVAGSTLTTVSLTGQRMTSGDLTAVLVAGRRYQIQSEVTGGGAAADFGIVRYCTLIPLL
jgi:hypothetical protein